MAKKVMCKNCNNYRCDWCEKAMDSPDPNMPRTCQYFCGQTNADRIRAMRDEELAKFIPDWSYTDACKCDELPYADCNNECEKCVLEWLKQPAVED